MKNFAQSVIDIVKKIPAGQVMSYKQVAETAGSPGAARAVGSIMAKNTDTTIPCHRVIRSDGNIGFYNGLCGNGKAVILEKEGYSPRKK